MPAPRFVADFNGLFDNLLCLSHGDSCHDETGRAIPLRSGMKAIAVAEDLNDRGERDNLIAAGTVERSPDWLQCNGSKWVLRIDANGVRHQSDLKDDV